MNPQIVIILIGQIGSGKTSYAKHYYSHFTRLNGDVLKTSKKVVSELKKALDRGENVIVDATNFTLERRRDIISECRVMPNQNPQAQNSFRRLPVKIYGVLFKVGIDECMERAKRREAKGFNDDGQPILHIPSIAFYKLNKSYVEPSLSEGFDYIGVFDPKVF